MTRRSLLSKIALGGIAAWIAPGKAETPRGSQGELKLTDEEWRKRLTPEQYRVLRREGTESPFSSALNAEKRRGVFRCVACDLPLFSSSKKFDSGTGWPSFYEALPGAFGFTTDYKLILPRTEYHCTRCGGHHGIATTDTRWLWNPRRGAENGGPDLLGKSGEMIRVCAEVNALEEPVGVIDAQMRRALARLATLEGRRFYFVRTASMKRRAVTKVVKTGCDIAVVQLPPATLGPSLAFAAPITSLAASPFGTPR